MFINKLSKSYKAYKNRKSWLIHLSYKDWIEMEESSKEWERQRDLRLKDPVFIAEMERHNTEWQMGIIREEEEKKQKAWEGLSEEVRKERERCLKLAQWSLKVCRDERLREGALIAEGLAEDIENGVHKEPI